MIRAIGEANFLKSGNDALVDFTSSAASNRFSYLASETLDQYESAIKAHMASDTTTQQGIYGFVRDSKVFFNSTANNAVLPDSSGNFVAGFKLSLGTQQFENFIKNGALQ
ncbi:hypothetical protein [Achromobacter spanius]|uniref:hypothetical protein n=1 Tax=Achromobacter spanius TaxID=217203 RepID=UPI003829144B